MVVMNVMEQDLAIKGDVEKIWNNYQSIAENAENATISVGA